MPAADPSRVSRRSVLAVLTAALCGVTVGGLSGCDAGSLTSPSRTTAPPTTPPSGGSAPADLAVLGDALTASRAVAAEVERARHRGAGLAARLGGFATLHADHQRALEAAGAAALPGRNPGPGGGDPLGRVLRREQALAERLRAWAQTATGGDVARLLLVMAAGVHQHLAALGVAPRVPDPAAPDGPVTPQETAALQAVLAQEHAAVYGDGVLGARTSARQTPELLGQVTSAYAGHRARRDQLTGALRALGAEPAAAAASYRLATDPHTPREVRDGAARIEEDCATAYAGLVAATGVTGRGWREWAGRRLEQSAVAAVRFGAAPSSFPGAPELIPG